MDKNIKYDDLGKTYEGKLIRRACALIVFGCPAFRDRSCTPSDAFKLVKDMIDNPIQDIFENVGETMDRLNLGKNNSTRKLND